RFLVRLVTGDFIPREILTIPILTNNVVVAVISLACLTGFSEGTMRLMDEVWDLLNARFNSILALRQIRVYSKTLELQNRELELQEAELGAQKDALQRRADEINEQNVELEFQKNQLEQASRLKTAFLSNMSHELRTPLNSVIALSSVLKRRLAGKIAEDEHDYIGVIERNGKHLLLLINDILDISRIEAGREEIRPGVFSIRELVGEVTEMIAPQAREKGLALESFFEEELPPVRSDLEKCRHILQNLIDNAVKFTKSGSVMISARQVDGRLRVAVRDSGIGIAADQLPHIFEEFRQADADASRSYGGAGLGLAIAEKYAAMLQGAITVESTPGKGSTFTLILPFTLSSLEPESAKPPGNDVGPVERPIPDDGNAPLPAAGKTVLLVEDNEPAIIQMTDILTEQGYEVHVARGGREALLTLEGLLPDAMILDLMMPEMDGFKVLETIRSREKTRSLPVLILTAKHVSREELSVLEGNHIHQLIRKGNVGR
ncbi:MAG: ATP-binding response regulator, partial [Syntrophobacteraceae bacterium]